MTNFEKQLMETAKSIQGLIATQGEASVRAFGLFGCIVRLSDDFETLRTWAAQKRRRAVTKEVRAALSRIAVMSIIAQAIEAGEVAS
jgi:hypothetical protein